MMAEMTLERAFKTISQAKHRGLKWSLLFRDGLASVLGEDADGRSYQIHPDDAVAVAEKLERDAAPPAKSCEVGEMAMEGTLADVVRLLSDMTRGREVDVRIDVTIPRRAGCMLTVGGLRGLLAAARESFRLREVLVRENHEIQQILGKALGYPWFKDDPKNFPEATEADGVCVGDHVAATLAEEAADRIRAAADGAKVVRCETINAVDIEGHVEPCKACGCTPLMKVHDAEGEEHAQVFCFCGVRGMNISIDVNPDIDLDRCRELALITWNRVMAPQAGQPSEPTPFAAEARAEPGAATKEVAEWLLKAVDRNFQWGDVFRISGDPPYAYLSIKAEHLVAFLRECGMEPTP